jgi:peptidoglycan hydrolase-like protein with peptidoglycan-binding domain
MPKVTNRSRKVRNPPARAQAVPAGRLAKTGHMIGRHPREFVALLMATVATGWIFTNALFLQKGPHPAPIFATRPVTHETVPLAPPRPQIMAPAPMPIPAPTTAPAPATAEQNHGQLVSNIQRELNRRGYYDGTVDGVWGARTDAAVRDFVQATGAKVTADANDALLRAIVAAPAKRAATPARTNDPIAALIAPSGRMLAVQRALNDFAYGPVKPTGLYDADTRAAIERFERARGLPVTGQISDRLVRELSSVVGRPLE